MILVDIKQFDSYRFSLLVAKIKNTKDQFDVSDNETYFKGSRYNDNERIGRMVIGNIYGEVKFDIEAAKSKFLSLNSEEIMPYIKAAVLDSASADHWYTYEKQW
jgi:hypothetical protein